MHLKLTWAFLCLTSIILPIDKIFLQFIHLLVSTNRLNNNRAFTSLVNMPVSVFPLPVHYMVGFGAPLFPSRERKQFLLLFCENIFDRTGLTCGSAVTKLNHIREYPAGEHGLIYLYMHTHYYAVVCLVVSCSCGNQKAKGPIDGLVRNIER